MVNDKNPEVITGDEALARLRKATEASGVIVGPIRFVGDSPFPFGPDHRRGIRFDFRAKGSGRDEVRASVDALIDAVDATDGIQFWAATSDGESDSPERAATAIYYTNVTAEQ